MSLKLSPAYSSVETAVKCGFKKIMADNNKHHLNEWGFWVILKVEKGQKSPNYHYTEPEGQNNGSSVTKTLPQGVSTVANCHTHTKKYGTGDFSSGDKRQFEDLRKIRPGIAYYLLNPQEEIRAARAAQDFPSGTVVPW